MVGGTVAPPRLDLANEDLARSHIHAIWLAETGQDLHSSLTELLDVSGDQPTLSLLPAVRSGSQTRQRHSGQPSGPAPSSAMPSPGRPGGGTAAASRDRHPSTARFDEACQRWKELYQVALEEFYVQSRRSVDISVRPGPRERQQAGPRRAGPAQPAPQRRLHRLPDRLLLLPVLRLRRVPARRSVPRLPLAADIPGRPGAATATTSSGPDSSGSASSGPAR